MVSFLYVNTSVNSFSYNSVSVFHLFTLRVRVGSLVHVPLLHCFLWEHICFMDERKTVRSLLARGSTEPVIGQNRSQHLTIPRELPLFMSSFKGGSPRLISCQATPVSGTSRPRSCSMFLTLLHLLMLNSSIVSICSGVNVAEMVCCLQKDEADIRFALSLLHFRPGLNWSQILHAHFYGITWGLFDMRCFQLVPEI